MAALAVVLACALSACGDGGPDPSASQRDGAASGHEGGTSSDAAMPPASEGGAPAPGFDASVLPVPPISGQLCSLRVGATCDGPEDCGAGKTCCAHFDSAVLGYKSIACVDIEKCVGPDDYELCHPGHPEVGSECRQAGHVCRRSVIVPHDFINVCADKVPAGVVDTSSRSRLIEGEVLCGESTCRAGEEACCLRSSFDFSTMMLTALAPYCAPPDATCDCADEPPPPPDASVEDDAG